ncbi:MAG: hypothetical protein ACLP1D_09985 [Xanthobacteraceae bacterium]
MDSFVHQQNLALYRRLLLEESIDPERRRILLKLLADEVAKEPSQEASQQPSQLPRRPARPDTDA